MRAVKGNLATPPGRDDRNEAILVRRVQLREESEESQKFPVLAQRAASEGPRWTRAVEDQSAPIPEELTGELGWAGSSQSKEKTPGTFCSLYTSHQTGDTIAGFLPNLVGTFNILIQDLAGGPTIRYGPLQRVVRHHGCSALSLLPNPRATQKITEPMTRHREVASAAVIG